MSSSIRWLVAIVLIGVLASCASTSPVRTWVTAPSAIWPEGQQVSVSSNSPEARWAAEQALTELGWAVSPASSLQLEVMARERVRLYTPPSDPFCDRRWAWPGYYGYWGYGPRWGCDPFLDRPRAQTLQEITWVVRDASGQTLWSASAQGTALQGPPLQLSRQLALSLTGQRSGVPLAP